MYNEHFYQDIVDHGAMLIWVAGLDKGCFYFNRAWLEFTGRNLGQEKGSGWTEGVHPDDFERCLQTYTQAFDARQKFSILYRLRRHDGIYRWLQDDGTPLYSATGEFKGFIGYCLDVTESKQIEIRAQQRSQLLQALSSGAPLSELLNSLSQNLESLYPYLKCKLNLLHSDTLARLGGDEFILVLTDLSQPEDYRQVLERLLLAASEPIVINDKLLQVSVSIGVTLFPEDQSEVDGLIRHADHAMYQAKQAGKNCYQLFQPLTSQPS